MGQVDGNLVQSAWSCYATYSQSTNDTSSTISITAGMRSHGYSMSLNGFWVGIDQGGYSKSSTETSFYSSTGGWVDKDLLNYTDTWTRTHEDRTINCWAAIDRSDAGYRPGKSTAWLTFTVPAKDHWTVSYNANNGSGAPESQTKWRDENLTLSSAKPTRTGYSFQGWATSADGAVAYQPGASYTSNAALTLYAVWKANTWTVKFDANGGSGAPANQTKTYGIDLTLSSTKPTKNLYNFLGWATSSSGVVAYQPGGKYTANADITLYAVWELAWVAPILSSPQCFRSNQNGVADDTGTYVHLSGDWVTDRAVKSIVATVNNVSTQISGTGKAGTISVTFGDGKLSAEQAYTVKLVITDEIGPGTWTWTISATHYILDFAPNGSIGVGTPADSSFKRLNSDLANTTSKLWMAGADGSLLSSGTAGYAKLVTITVTNANANIPLRFVVSQKATRQVTVDIVMSNSGTTTPTVFLINANESYNSESDNFLYYYTSGSKTTLYAKKSENWDAPRIVDVSYDPYYASGKAFSLDFSYEHLNALPSGAVNIKNRCSGFIPGSGLTLSGGTLSVPGSKLLWSADGSVGSSTDIGTVGGFMKNSQIATLAEPISQQTNGIVLLWSFFNADTNEGTTYYRNYCFVDKHTLEYDNGVAMILGADAGDWIAVKYMYFTDNTITGNGSNASNYPNVCSVNWYNRYFVLIKVYGV